MFENFEPISVTTQSSPEVTIRGLRSTNTSKQLPPLLLLHGFPQTLHIWHRVAPQLTDMFTVVLLDLRGYGSSSKPAGEVGHYAKSVMARDCVATMAALGYGADSQSESESESGGGGGGGFYLCGHDRGARVGHKLCVDYPRSVRRALFLDICPTLAMYEATDVVFARAYFHWFFLIQPYPLPEMMMLGADARQLAQEFMGGRPGGAGLRCIFAEDCFEEYVKGLGDRDTVHAMCQDYRAAATLDLEEQRRDLAEGRRIQCPLRVLWGNAGIIETCFDAVSEWRKVTDEGASVDGHAVDSGHYIPEQAPQEVVSAIREFCV